MSEGFDGNYFDGQSAKPQPVIVRIHFERIGFTTYETGFSREVHLQEIVRTEFIRNNHIIIHFGKDGTELIDVRSEQFCKLFRNEFSGLRGGANALEKFANTGWKQITGLVGLLVGVILLIYFFLIPFIGDVSARFFPKVYEEKLGEMIYENIIEGYRVDSAKTALVNELIEKVDFKTGYELKIVVVDYDKKNAFAMPGGYIIIYSGIMEDMDDYPEMIGLLAHEVSHINKRHTLRSLFRSLSSYIFISILLNDINGVSTIVLENVNSIKTLSFSRKLEQEADLEGLNTMFRNKADPNGMLKLLKNLMKDRDLPAQMEFLSSHPVTKNRIEYIEKKIKESDPVVKTDDEMKKTWQELKEKGN